MADGSVVIEILGDVSKFSASLAKVERLASSALGSLGSAADAAGTALTAGVTAPLAAAGAVVGKWALQTASAAEQADIAFTTMLGPEKAKQMLSDLADFAAKTPFEMEGLTSATQKLLAYGFAAENVIPLLTSVGDATAGLGAGQEGIDAVTRALGQMQAKGKVYAEEMMQLTEVGIPAWEYLADALGTDVAGAQELVTAGAVDATTAISALQDGMDRDFGGLMAKQAETLQGRLSNLVDAAANAARKLKDTDGWESATAAIGRLADSIGPLVDKIVPVADKGLQRLAGVVEDVAGAVDGLDSGDVEKLATGLVKAAAAGPALVVAGKGLTAVSKGMDLASSASSALSKAASGASDKLLDLATSPKSADTALGKLATTLLSVPGPTVAAAAGVTVLAGVALAAFVSSAMEAQQEAETYASAMDVLSSATDLADGSMRGAAEGAEQLGGKVYELAAGVSENYADIAALADAFAEADAEANAQISSLQSARQAIAEYGGQSDLTAQQQGALRAAVETLNDQCGTNYEVVRQAGGSYEIMADGASVAKDEIYELIDAQIAQAKVDAQMSKLEELYKAQADQAADYAEALAAVEDAQKRVNEAREAAEGSDSPWITAELADAENDLESLTDTAEEYRAQMAETGDAITGVEQNIGNLTNAASGAAEGFDALVQGSQGLNALFSQTGGDIEDFAADLEASGIPIEQWRTLTEDQLMAVAAAWDGSSESISGALASSGAVLGEFSGILAESSEGMQETASIIASALGMPLDQFEQKLTEAGISTATLNEVGSANLMAMAASCGGSIDTLTWMLQNYNNVPIVDKNGNVTADTTQLIDAQGNVWTWNGTELVDKQGSAVVYWSDLTQAQQEKVVWNESGIATLDGKAVVDDSELIDAQGNKVEWNGTELKNKSAVGDIDASGIQRGIDLLNTWNSMTAQNKSATFTTTNRTINIVENQTVSSGGRAAPASAQPMALSAAPAAAAARASDAAGAAASATVQAAAARLAAVPAGAFRSGSAIAAIGEAATSAVEGRAAAAAAAAVAKAYGDLEAGLKALGRKLDAQTKRLEGAIESPVELRANRREIGRLIKEVS